MTDEVKRLIDVMAMLNKCSETPCFKCDQLEFNGEIACNNEASVYQHAAKLLQDFSSELEQVKAERDGLSIMLTSAMSAAHTFKRKLEEAGHKSTKTSPLVLGRMNGRHDGYNVLFSAIDELPEKPCNTCVNRDWDMPQCRVCNFINKFRWYVKED